MNHFWPQFVDTAVDGSPFPTDPVQLCFGSRDPEVMDKALLYLVRSPMSVFMMETTGSAWRCVPVAYMFTQQNYYIYLFNYPTKHLVWSMKGSYIWEKPLSRYLLDLVKTLLSICFLLAWYL